MHLPIALFTGPLVAAAIIAAAQVPPRVAEALQRAAADARSTIEVLSVSTALPASCVVDDAIVRAPIRATGRIAARLAGALPNGAPCGAWALVDVRVSGPVVVVTKAIGVDAPLEGATEVQHREWRSIDAPFTPTPDARAKRALRVGEVVQANAVRLSGPAPGAAVEVEVHAGDVVVTTTGTAIACSGAQICARLPTGKRVSGRMQGARLVVELP